MKERDTNMELLRIIAMWMITVHHFLVNTGMTYSGIVGRAPLVSGYEWATMLNGFVYIGVNCFILISGYYGIKFKWKGLFKLWIFCAFYELCTPIIRHLLYGTPVPIMQTLHDSIFCFSFTHNWFIMCYVCLYFLSPLLNYARNNMDKPKYLTVLGLLTILTIYFGFWRHIEYWNADGYSVANFIYLYMIGGFVQKHVQTEKMMRRGAWFTIYSVCAMMWGGLTVLKFKYGILGHWSPITYNNPFTLIGAIAFFLMMRTVHIKSKSINWIAQSVLAVVMFTGVSYKALDGFVLSYLGVGILKPILSAVISASILFVGIILFDQIRILVFKPIWLLWDFVEQKVQGNKFANLMK